MAEASSSSSDETRGEASAVDDGDQERRPLPLEAVREASGDALPRTWTIRLRVRAEQVTLTKPVVVSEEVTIRVHPTSETVTIGSDTRREELHLSKQGKPVVHEATAPANASEGGR